MLSMLSLALVLAAPCASTPHRAFDFWLGNWDVHNEKGEVVGTNSVKSLMGGCVIQENWKGAKGSRGQSYNMFYERDGKWHQSWVDASGTRLDLAGGLVKGEMVLGGVMPGPKGKPVKHEIRFKLLDDARIRQHWRVSTDDGKTWKDVFLGFYKKRDDTVDASKRITQAALDYAVGWYTGNGKRMERALHPELAKRRSHVVEGKDGRKWDKLDQMSALTLVQHTRDRKADKGALRKEVEILDIQANAATVKLTMNHWIDYLHLSRLADGRWVIVNVLWEKI